MSYAPDHEDVVLWRALADVADGRYADLRPDRGQVTRALHERGWTGFVRAGDRPDDVAVEGPSELPAAPLHLLLWASDLTIADLADVLDRTQPWVVVAPAKSAIDEALAAKGYRAALYDGFSRFHLAAASADRAPALDRPASSRDGYVDAAVATVRAENEELRRELVRWRGIALKSWASWEPRRPAEWTIHDERERDSLREEIEKMQRTLSWRVTRPLRALRRVNPR